MDIQFTTQVFREGRTFVVSEAKGRMVGIKLPQAIILTASSRISDGNAWNNSQKRRFASDFTFAAATPEAALRPIRFRPH